MRPGLIIFGAIIFAIGALFYYFPTPTAQATTTSITDQGTDTRTSYASFIVPIQVTFAFILSGAIIFILGLLIPGAHNSSRVTKTREYLGKSDNQSDNGRTVVREHRETREHNS